MRQIIFSALLVAFITSSFFAQGAPQSGAMTTAVPDQAFARRVLDAWESMNPDNVTPYYDKSPQNLYFDIAPRKYTGWTEYRDGVKALLTGYQSIKFRVNPDLTFRRNGNIVVGDGTLEFDTVAKDGTKATLPMRWTVIWEKKGANWLIVHEHTSVPMQQ